ncbi:uncharacterized protein LOC142227173 [Haematobia irritans]|uniref:uncharacterized protein LOC142227173 n=1 Tax=Haematobia irritans TaxID=7368 RepID=UPI003F4F5870
MSIQNMISVIIIYITIANNIYTILSKEAFCYSPVFMNSSWTDNRPDFSVNMTFQEQGTIFSEATVRREIAFPVSKLTVVQKEFGSMPSTIYNVSARLCDISSFFNKVPVIKQAFLSATKQSNLSFNCPLKPGFYVMGNMRIGNRNPILSFMNRPRVVFTIAGGLYEELKNKTLLPLTTYKFAMKVVKKPC